MLEVALVVLHKYYQILYFKIICNSRGRKVAGTFTFKTIGQQGPKIKRRSDSVVWQKPLKSRLVFKNLNAIGQPSMKSSEVG